MILKPSFKYCSSIFQMRNSGDVFIEALRYTYSKKKIIWFRDPCILASKPIYSSLAFKKCIPFFRAIDPHSTQMIPYA